MNSIPLHFKIFIYFSHLDIYLGKKQTAQENPCKTKEECRGKYNEIDITQNVVSLII